MDRATEEAALAAHQRADRARAEAESELGVLRERLAAARAEAADPQDATGAPEPADATGARAGTEAERDSASVPALRAVVDRLAREHQEAHRLAAGTHAAREALAAAEREHLGRLDDRQQAERRAMRPHLAAGDTRP